MGSMRLEKVEIVGFKSFCDKQELSFKGGVTGIVGPNGCGKSNISDAISWVLGEQSAKSLRGASMEDVIFAGSQSRQPLAMAEVNLKVSGLNGNSPDGYPECVVTRRLYRNGESEYLMNGAGLPPARRPRAVHGHRPRQQGLLDHRAGQDRPDPLQQARGSPRPHRGGGRHHQVQGAAAADPAQAGGRPAEPAARERHRPRGREAAREPEAPGQQGAPLPRACARRCRGSSACSTAGASSSSWSRRAPWTSGSATEGRARARGRPRPGDRRGADGGAPARPLRRGGAARGGARPAERADPGRGPPPGHAAATAKEQIAETEDRAEAGARGKRKSWRRGWGPSRRHSWRASEEERRLRGEAGRSRRARRAG